MAGGLYSYIITVYHKNGSNTYANACDMGGITYGDFLDTCVKNNSNYNQLIFLTSAGTASGDEIGLSFTEGGEPIDLTLDMPWADGTISDLTLYALYQEPPTYTLHGHIGTWHMEWVPGEDDYSAMRGPCDEGYHVPLSSEWQSVYNAGVTIGAWTSSGGNNLSSYLKLPFAGGRNYSTSDIVNQGSNGLYWSSSRNSGSSAYDVLFNSSTIYPQFNNLRALGASVRPFKDIPVVPNGTWTKLYGTSIEAGGIFRSSSLGLISMSSNGTTWITIADKNLGASSVWNSGNTLSEANCGKYYQRGNNYGFPFTGNVTTSSTQVNASTYGPGNYYNSSTFITYGGRRDTTDNGNLRGGVTGVVPTGHYRPRQPVVLKTYEEIAAMANAEGLLYTNTLNELNTYPIDYYNMLNNGGYYGQNTAVPTNHIIGIENIHDGDYYYIRYNNGTRSRGIY